MSEVTAEHSDATTAFCTVPEAIAAIARGEAIVVVDDEDRENEGDLIIAAEAATPESLAFFVRHTSGVICVSLTGDRLDELDIPLMVRENNTESQRTAFTYTVDAIKDVTTGISAADRSTTIAALIDPASRPSDLSRSSPCATPRAACSSAPATPRRPSTWPEWRACTRPACCARSSTTTAPCPGCPTWRSSAPSTIC